jgi:chaperonin cofactor prefoldin
LSKNEASQTVVFQGEPVFMRSPKITRPHDVSTPDFAARILAELKRTRIAVRNEIQGIDVDDIVLCGSGKMFESLAEQLTKGLETTVRLFDPLKGLTVKASDADEQYAALFGAIQQVFQKEPLQIDFCNPKKRTEDTSKRNLFTGIAVAALLLVVGLFGYIVYSRMTLNAEVAELKQEFAQLRKTAGTVVEQKKQLDEIDKWLMDDVNWFKQLGWLSENALSSEDMMIRNLELASSSSGVTVRFVALLRNQSLVASMQERFRDLNHTPLPGRQGTEAHARYTYTNDMTIRLSKNAETPTQPEQTPDTL